MVIIFHFLLNDTRLLMPLQLTLRGHLQFLNICCALNYWLQRNVEITGEIHETNCELWGNFFVNFLLVQQVKVFHEMLFEFFKA